MLIQSQQEQLGRSYQLPRSEAGSRVLTTVPLKADRSGLVFGWDSQGQPTAVSAVPVGSVAFSAFWLAACGLPLHVVAKPMAHR